MDERAGAVDALGLDRERLDALGMTTAAHGIGDLTCLTCVMQRVTIENTDWAWDDNVWRLLCSLLFIQACLLHSDLRVSCPLLHPDLQRVQILRAQR